MSGLDVEIAAAKQEVAAAEQKVAAAEQNFAAAEQKYNLATDDFRKTMAQEYWEAASVELRGAQLYLASARTAAGKTLEQQRPPRHPNSPTATDFNVLVSRLEAMTLKGRTIYSSQSSGTRAQIVEKEVSSSEDFVPRENTPSVITSEEAAKLASLTDEKQIVAFLLPKMEACFASSNLVVVDSQDFPWLPQLSQQRTADRVKPDGFVTHWSLYVPRDENSKQVLDGTRAKRNGTPADDRLLPKEVYIIEGKKGTSLKGQLELVDYMNLMSEYPQKGVVIGKEGFWLIKACRLVIQERTKAKWIEPGTKELLATFFEPSNLCKAVDEVCDKLGCEIANEPDRPSFLGAGGYGTVLRVRKNDLEMALKVTIGNKDLLSTEFHTLKSINDANPSLPVVSAENIYNGHALNAGYLMTPVGEPIEPLRVENRQKTHKTVGDLFASLQKLHDAGYTHGDPRFENAIRSETSLLWVDFMQLGGGPKCNENSIRFDFKQLAWSIFRHAGIFVVEPDMFETDSKFASVRAAIATYDGTDPSPVIDCMVDTLCGTAV